MLLRGVLLLLLSVVLLNGCGPSYRTYSHYTPPADTEGRTCALRCEDQRRVCDSQCQARFESCVEQAKADAKLDYLNAKEHYVDEKASCLRYNKKGEEGCKHISEPQFSNYIDDAHCRQDCACEPDFERCFQLCGGTIERETRCVSGCYNFARPPARSTASRSSARVGAQNFRKVVMKVIVEHRKTSRKLVELLMQVGKRT